MSKSALNPEVFIEVQKFTQWWLWTILIFCNSVTLFSVHQRINNSEYIPSEIGNITLVIALSVMLIALVFFVLIRLRTDINSSGIHVRMYPFLNRSVKWRDVNSAQVVNYGFIGGWGIRLWTSYGTVYNVKGDKGLAIKLENGKKFLIGTQREQELSDFIKKIKETGN